MPVSNTIGMVVIVAFAASVAGIADCHDHRRPTAGQLDRQLGQPVVSALSPSIFERDILAFDEARCIQSPLNGRETETADLLRAAEKDADHGHRRLLRARCKRPSPRRRSA
jgi:hypothetical protein